MPFLFSKMIHHFKKEISSIPLPKKFTFPFYYEPHPLAKIAAQEIQNHLENLKNLDHNFGLDNSKDGLVIGKMFGVLVVQKANGELGYLAAFSGKLGNENHHVGFVPPVYDLLDKNGFFLEEEKELNELTFRIEKLENSDEFIKTKDELEQLIIQFSNEIQNIKKEIKENKKLRDLKRKTIIDNGNDDKDLLDQLNKQSIQESYFLKDRTNYWKSKKENIETKIEKYKTEINELKNLRRQKSSDCQQLIFEQYTFLNADKKLLSLKSIFEENLGITPPAGAGECAAPKLLHHAFSNDLKPICIAEFWWGASPASEIRKHKQFYPACKGKCEPILNHMLQGLVVDENPMLINPALNKNLPIIFEDDDILLINKPEEFLSVPGKNIKDSVYTRIQKMYPDAIGPLRVHRLDMSTSGIMILAKNIKSYHHLQRQFLKRQIKKRYVALLENEIKIKKGTIELPLRVDLDDRPRQVVCYEYGKHAKTEYEEIELINGKSKVYFYPITGRTHQLRVHASHTLGLNTPIIGDDLYGNKAERLYLHAEMISFRHPKTLEMMTFRVEANF
jgi:tRNA pseudouridine32 synthase/23S rRNA pseudouridine746 synthase